MSERTDNEVDFATLNGDAPLHDWQQWASRPFSPTESERHEFYYAVAQRRCRACRVIEDGVADPALPGDERCHRFNEGLQA